MVPKFKKSTPTKSLKATRRRPKKPSSSPIAASLRSCRRRLLGLFSLLSPSNLGSHRRHGFHKLTPLPLPLHQPLPPPPPSPPSPSPSPSKPTLFLDLDETLVHSTPQPPPDNAAYDFIVYPKIDRHVVPLYVSKRPGVDRFLRRAAEQFELVVFTAGVREYASLVLDGLDPEGAGLISHSLYRDSCREVGGRLVKDLSGRGRDLARVLLVDDNPSSYALQPENAVPVAPFLGDREDRELDRVMGFLETALVYEDIRDAAVNSSLPGAGAGAGVVEKICGGDFISGAPEIMLH